MGWCWAERLISFEELNIVMERGKYGASNVCLAEFSSLIGSLLCMGRLFLSGLIGIGKSCLILDYSGGCFFVVNGSNPICNLPKSTIIRSLRSCFSWDFSNWSRHPRSSEGTKRARRVYKKWSNIDPPPSKISRLWVWYDQHFWVVTFYFSQFLSLCDTPF